MTVDAVSMKKAASDVLFVSESLKSSFKIVAYDPSDLTNPKSHIIQSDAGKVNFLRSTNGGSTLLAAAASTLIMGALKQKNLHSLEDLVYDFYSLNITDDICSLSIRHTAKKTTSKKKVAAQDSSDSVIDVAVGCARGAIFVYADLLTQLQGKSKKGLDVPKKQHWHRKAVHSVAWSTDGKLTRLCAQAITNANGVC